MNFSMECYVHNLNKRKKYYLSNIRPSFDHYLCIYKNYLVTKSPWLTQRHLSLSLYMCVYVCVWERKREREREGVKIYMYMCVILLWYMISNRPFQFIITIYTFMEIPKSDSKITSWFYTCGFFYVNWRFFQEFLWF